MYLPSLIYETMTIKRSMCEYNGSLIYNSPCLSMLNEEGNYDVTTLSKTLLKRGWKILGHMTRNFGVIFTPHVTNSREYNNRIPHIRSVESARARRGGAPYFEMCRARVCCSSGTIMSVFKNLIIVFLF